MIGRDHVSSAPMVVRTHHRLGPPRAHPRLPLGSFVGREGLLGSIAARIAADVSMLTLVGPPGAGKTRLAQRFAEMAAADTETWPGGAMVIDLAQAHDRADLLAALARALGAEPTQSIGPRLATFGALLLVLDNFEQLAKDARAEIAEWCREAPSLRVLVTSRERLDVEGESVLEIGPLELSSEAVQLFEARVIAARGRGFDDAEEAHEIAELVRELDGLPLAIELAAARTRMLTPREIRQRLGQRFQLLSRQPRREDDRHATLEAAIDASWAGLRPVEQSALADCAVFAGSFTLEAAERVIGREVLDTLGTLVDRSLLIAEPSGHEMRYRLLLSIRAFAADRLGERAAEKAARHRAYYVEASRSRRDQVTRSGDAVARAWLERESENLRAILRGSSDEAHVEAALALDMVSLGRSSEDRMRALDVAIAITAPVAVDLRARLLVARGRVAGMAGLADLAVRDFTRAVELAAHYPAIAAEALVQLSVRFRQNAAPDEARAVGERALELVRGTEHPRVEAEGWVCLGLTYGELDRPDQAHVADERALAMFRAIGDVGSQGFALGNLAQLAQSAGEMERADRLYEEALQAFRAVNDLAYEGVYLGFRAGLAHERGDLARARALYQEAVDRLARAGARHVHGLMVGALAALEAADDRIADAERHMAEAERSAETAAVPAYKAALALYKAQLDLAEARAATKLGQVAAARAHRARAEQRRRDATHADVSASVRSAQELLDRALADGQQAPKVRIDPAGAWFEIGDNSRVDLGRRGALRRLLRALVEARGAPLDQEALIAAGWPGERVLAEAASTRVRVAISTLRRLGLGARIVTRDQGYALITE